MARAAEIGARAFILRATAFPLENFAISLIFSALFY